MKKDFLSELVVGIARGEFNFYRDNTDYLRFPTKPLSQLRSWIVDNILSASNKLGWHRFPGKIEDGELEYTMTHRAQFQGFYDLLEDEDSKQLLIELIKFRILGPRHIQLPRNNADYWKKVRSISQYFKKTSSFKGLGEYAIQIKNTSLYLHCGPLNILNTFLLGQYACRKGGKFIGAESGDVVIDAGACYGDTTLDFADRVGASGKVYSFEFDPQNLKVLEKNLGLNGSLSSRIINTPKALWSESYQKLPYTSAGPGSSLFSRAEASAFAETISIDDFVEQQKISKIDLIKMDIEGSEKNALMGAVKTIRAFRPKLAISIYHLKDDFIRIPQFLNDLKLGYTFFMDHFTIHNEETVLFATAAHE